MRIIEWIRVNLLRKPIILFSFLFLVIFGGIFTFPLIWMISGNKGLKETKQDIKFFWKILNE